MDRLCMGLELLLSEESIGLKTIRSLLATMKIQEIFTTKAKVKKEGQELKMEKR